MLTKAKASYIINEGGLFINGTLHHLELGEGLVAVYGVDGTRREHLHDITAESTALFLGRGNWIIVNRSILQCLYSRGDIFVGSHGEEVT